MGRNCRRGAALDEALLHERVDGEWSFIETLRHLCYATDAWVNRVYLGDPDPWDRWTSPSTPSASSNWRPRPAVRPTLEEVLACGPTARRPCDASSPT